MIQLLGDKFSSGASVRNEDGMLPLHLVIIACASPLVATIGSDIEPVDVVQAVLKYFPGAIGVADNEGNLPIHTAASVLHGPDGASKCFL
jgi:ankyrin repeat protein